MRTRHVSQRGVREEILENCLSTSAARITHAPNNSFVIPRLDGEDRRRTSSIQRARGARIEVSNPSSLPDSSDNVALGK